MLEPERAEVRIEQLVFAAVETSDGDGVTSGIRGRIDAQQHTVARAQMGVVEYASMSATTPLGGP